MTYSKYLLLYLLLVFSGCYSHKKSIDSSLPHSQNIHWPDRYEPLKAKFFIHNEIDIQAPPSVVWDILVRAENWPSWYEGASEVKIQGDSLELLTANAVFTWKTMGLDFTSTIEDYQAPFRLSWESKRNSIKGYHAWLIIPTEQGCKLITEESQYGWLTFFQKALVPHKLRKLHDIWLIEIKNIAESP